MLFRSGSAVKILNQPAPPPFKESVRCAEQNLYVRPKELVGDRDQLPPVAPGSTLRDLILSSRFPVIALSHIYRQKEGSDVIELAHRIRQGYADASDFTKDIRWIPCEVHDVKNVILHVVNEALNKGYNVNDVQILAPKYSGVAGIDGLNHAMQKMVNPQDNTKRELKVGYVTYREQDKILQLKNQPTDDVYNGDIGTLIEIVPSDRKSVV